MSPVRAIHQQLRLNTRAAWHYVLTYFEYPLSYEIHTRWLSSTIYVVHAVDLTLCSAGSWGWIFGSGKWRNRCPSFLCSEIRHKDACCGRPRLQQVGGMLRRCYDDVMTMLWWYDDVMMMLWWCYDGAMVMVWWWYEDVMMTLWWYDDVMTMLWCYDDVTMMLRWCYDDVMMMLWYTPIFITWFSPLLIARAAMNVPHGRQCSNISLRRRGSFPFHYGLISPISVARKANTAKEQRGHSREWHRATEKKEAQAWSRHRSPGR